MSHTTRDYDRACEDAIERENDIHRAQMDRRARSMQDGSHPTLYIPEMVLFTVADDRLPAVVNDSLSTHEAVWCERCNATDFPDAFIPNTHASRYAAGAKAMEIYDRGGDIPVFHAVDLGCECRPAWDTKNEDTNHVPA